MRYEVFAQKFIFRSTALSCCRKTPRGLVNAGLRLARMQCFVDDKAYSIGGRIDSKICFSSVFPGNLSIISRQPTGFDLMHSEKTSELSIVSSGLFLLISDANFSINKSVLIIRSFGRKGWLAIRDPGRRLCCCPCKQASG